ncbi:MAG: helix-turn-helix domain-containing protein, partial [Ignavibacteria bacterium]
PSYISNVSAANGFSGAFKSLDIAISEFEKDYIQKALAQNDYDKEKTARMLGISTATLYRKIKELKILT